MKKSWFTLVEMLIVVVIVGILSAALLPRLNGTIAKTRDTRRQADLRNVATAITLYKNEHGALPILSSWVKINNQDFTYFMRVGSLWEILWDYISWIPQDPSRNSQVDICGGMSRETCNEALGKWEYLYQVVGESRDNPWKQVGLLLAKVETPFAANFMVLNDGPWDRNPWTQVGMWFIGGPQFASLGVSRFLGLGRWSEWHHQELGGRPLLAASVACESAWEEKCKFDPYLNRYIKKTCCKSDSFADVDGDYCYLYGEGESCSPSWSTSVSPYVSSSSPRHMLCNELDKVAEGEERREQREDGKLICHYSSVAQLYHMVIID